MKKSLLFLTFSLFIFLTSFAQTWNQYPYAPVGTNLTFPTDEGYHPGEPVEWWYTIGHVTGANTGTNYSFMLTYFYYPQLNFDGFRIFNLSNDDSETFFAETLPTNYPVMAQDHLEINADVLLGSGQQETWVTRTEGSELLPFSYHVNATQANGSIDLDYEAQKRPLILDTTGFFYQGATGYTYYYSQTMLNVNGNMTIDGVTEPVSGTAWIDRQWGQFNPNNGEKYEWFCVQLDNGMDFNIWNIFNTANEIPDLPTYRLTSIYVDETHDINTHDFQFDRQTFVYTPDSLKVYPQQWHFVYDTIDIMITTLYPNSEVSLPFRFYEGTTSVTGMVGNTPVTGVGFAELLHSYSKPEVNAVVPADGISWAPGLVTWTLANPEGGREIWYDVEYSTDNKQSWNSISQGLTDTQVAWDATGVNYGTEVWLRITAYSIDHTLTGKYETQTPFKIGAVGINEHIVNELSVYPNPSINGNFVITMKDASLTPKAIQLLTLQGKQVLYKTLNAKAVEGGKIELQLNGLAAGTYLARVEMSNGKTATVRLCIAE
jgi:predicted secreted hydrolase